MPKCTIEGKQIEVPEGTNILTAALSNGIHIQHFCWHADLSVDGNCRTCMVEIEKVPKLQIACNTVVQEGMVVRSSSPKAREAQRSALEFLLVNHPIDCPVCDQAGECYLQDNYMRYGLYGAEVELEDKIRKRKLVDLGPIMLDAERCVLCSRCIRFESEVTKTCSFQFRERGGHTQITTFDQRPITHEYAGNLADVCPVGALLSHDFRFKMRVWFLEETESICPGCSTGCNITIDHRDGEAQRLRPRRNVEVNKSWMCDPGRKLVKGIGGESRLSGARLRRAASWEGVPVSAALDEISARLKEAGSASAFLATPQGTNEDLFAFRTLAEAVGGMLDFRVGDPQDRVRVRLDQVLQRADRNPNTQGCLDLGLGRSGVAAILEACRAGKIKALLLQGRELLHWAEAAEAVAKVPFIAVMATHEGPELDRVQALLPVAMWAEVEGTFTSYARRVQRIRRAFAAPGSAMPRWELSVGLLHRLGKPLPASSARDMFAHLTQATADYAGLDYKGLGSAGRALASGEPTQSETRAQPR